MESKNVNLRQYSTLESHVFETLICLEYLLRFTSEDKPTKQKDIVEFAENKYHFFTRRDRIGTILKIIYENREILKDKYNIDIQRVYYLDCDKYYVDSRLLYDDEIKTIMLSITANQGLSSEITGNLKDKIFNLTHKDNDSDARNKIEAEIVKEQYRLRYFSKKDIDIYAKIKSYGDQHKFITIKLKERFYKSLLKEEFIAPFTLEGRIYNIYNLKDKIYINFLSNKNNEIVSIKLDDILKITAPYQAPGMSVEQLNEIFKKDGYKDIEDYINKNPNINNSNNKDKLVFEIYTSCPDYQYIKNQFYNVFGQDFTLAKAVPLKNGKGKLETVEIEADSYSIYMFLKDFSVLYSCNIISPDSTKKLLMSQLSRIKKHLHTEEE